MREFGAGQIRNQRQQAVRAAVAWRRRACKSMAPLQRSRGDHRWAEGARYRSAPWASGRSGSGNFETAPQLAAEAEGSGSAEEGQGAWDRRRWRLDRSECHGTARHQTPRTRQKGAPPSINSLEGESPEPESPAQPPANSPGKSPRITPEETVNLP